MVIVKIELLLVRFLECCVCVCTCTHTHTHTHIKSSQSYLTLFDPTDCSPPGSSVHGRHEYWSGLPCPPPGDFPYPRMEPGSPALQVDSSPLRHQGSPLRMGCVCLLLSHVQVFVTPWTVACQAPLPMEFSRQEYWSGLPFYTLVHSKHSLSVSY